MERESFEDEKVAEILNRSYIAVKVDREERPDIDHMYMTYCQLMTGSGGWPLTVLLTPDKQPFFAGTYFPKHSGYGRPGLLDVLKQVAELWSLEKDKVIKTAEELYDAVLDHYRTGREIGPERSLGIKAIPANEGGIEDWGKELIRKGYALLEQSFDSRFGGFGNAPKFPSPHNLGFLLRYSLAEPKSKALAMVEKTLDSMADGGIYDHIGYGFARYSTDRYWLVPHFEKMLYDNAGLAFVYLEAYQLTKKEKYGRVAREIFEYVLRDMSSSEGGFYSAEDADSEGEEGKFYVWDKLEMRRVLLEGLSRIKSGKASLSTSQKEVLSPYLDQGEKLFALYCEVYGISEEGNYEGKNIPNRIFTIPEEIAQRYDLDKKKLETLTSACNRILFWEREKRVHPFKDDKILVSWNGLMIAALAKGVQVFSAVKSLQGEREKYLLAAEKAVMFIFSKLINTQGRLLARYRQGDASFLGYLDDYAFLVYGLLELYTACGKPEYLRQALKLQEDQERLFRDNSNGGYFFTGNDAEELLFKPKESYDGAMPSGNSLSAYNLARLWKITGEDKWRELAEEQICFLKTVSRGYPAGYTAYLQAVQFYLGKGEELVISGSLESGDVKAMSSVLFAGYRPYGIVVYNEGTVEQILPRIRNYPAAEKAKAYLCRNFTCREPVDEAEKLKILLAEQ